MQTSYTVAGLVGAARIYHDAHFASDVLADVSIGTLAGKSVVAHNKPLRSPKVVAAWNHTGIGRYAPHKQFPGHANQKGYIFHPILP